MQQLCSHSRSEWLLSQLDPIVPGFLRKYRVFSASAERGLLVTGDLLSAAAFADVPGEGRAGLTFRSGPGWDVRPQKLTEKLTEMATAKADEKGTWDRTLD